MRRRGRTDANQTGIVDALRQAGCSVLITSNLGQGAPDILCGFRGRSYPMEIKMPGAQLTDDEREWHANWKGNVYIVHSEMEALDAIGAI